MWRFPENCTLRDLDLLRQRASRAGVIGCQDMRYTVCQNIRHTSCPRFCALGLGEYFSENAMGSAARLQ